MARVFIPAQWRDLSQGQVEVEVPGATVGQVISALDERFPGVRERLGHDGGLASGLAVSIDGTVTARGMLAPVGPQSEVHFLPAIGGG